MSKTIQEKEIAAALKKQSVEDATALMKRVKEEILRRAWKEAPPPEKIQRFEYIDQNIRHYLTKYFNPNAFTFLKTSLENTLLLIQREAENAKPGASISQDDVKAILHKHAEAALRQKTNFFGWRKKTRPAPQTLRDKCRKVFVSNKPFFLGVVAAPLTVSLAAFIKDDADIRQQTLAQTQAKASNLWSENGYQVTGVKSYDVISGRDRSITLVLKNNADGRTFEGTTICAKTCVINKISPSGG